MNIVVLVKQVPDSGAERTLSHTDHTLDREDTEPPWTRSTSAPPKKP
ncbi:hypothetical protein [Streptomyces sp. NPDC088350]